VKEIVKVEDNVEIRLERARPFISIVMPVYNNKKLLPNAVNSVRNQTFPDWELILINDGSTDGTAQLADSFAKADHRIRVIHQENRGIYQSFNIGYAAALGKYVLIVNSDDTINPDALREIYDIAIVDGADIVMFNLTESICDAEQNVLISDIYKHKNLLKKHFSYRSCEEIRRAWPYFLKWKLIGHQCVYRENIYKTYTYEGKYYGDDVLYNQRIATAITVAAGTPYPVYNFYRYECETMNASNGKYYGYEHKMFDEMYSGNQRLLLGWGVNDFGTMEIIAAERLSQLTLEIRSYLSPQCPLLVEEKIRKILEDASTKIVYGCAESINKIEEWESRILSGLRELLIKEPLNLESPYYFLYELLDNLLRYEKDEEDIQKIRAAVYHEKNPKHIGLSFLRKLCIE
jgi:glycosyltransferase involved in cell wall biosynthesis